MQTQKDRIGITTRLPYLEKPCETLENYVLGGGSFNFFLLFTPICGEMIQFDLSHILQMGWFNQQLLLMEEIPNNHLGWC